MLSPGRVALRRAAPRLGSAGLYTSRRSNSTATSAPQTSQYSQQETPGLWPSTKGSTKSPSGGGAANAIYTAQPAAAPRRLKELREQEGLHQVHLARDNLATGPLSCTKSGDQLFLRSRETGESITLDAAALRDGCQCATCKDPSSGQKSFASVEIPNDISIDAVRETPDGVGVTFTNEIPRFAAHETTVPWESIEKAFGVRAPTDMAILPPLMNNVRARTGITLWDRDTIDRQVRKVDYADFMRGGAAMWSVVRDLVRLGLVYLENVPREEDAIIKITTRIASIRETFYGRTFDVRAKPNAENVAYTSGYLGLHQDLLYLDPPPKIQILHCLDNSCEGGESLFSDGERAARLLLNHGSLASPLRDAPVPYAYTRNGYNYAQRRPLLHYDREGRFENVFWSPPFQGGRDADAAPLKPWLKGARVFERLINGAAAMHQKKMRPGECVLFDNLRVMHGRTAFDTAGGSRWLRGAYIAQEDFVSVASQIPAEVLEGDRNETVWYEGHQEKALANAQWAAEAQKLVAEEA